MKLDNGKIIVISIISLLIFSIFIPSITSIEEDDMDKFKKIAFIYSSDETTADIFKTFLENNGYSVDKILMDDVNITDFSNYALISLGYET